MEMKLDMTTRHKTFFGCLQASLVQDFLLVILIDGLSHHMSQVKYRTIPINRLMIPLFSIDEMCIVCCKAWLDTFG